MIKEAYVPFDIAKLLKEKGFKGECRTCYTSDGRLIHLNNLIVSVSDVVIDGEPAYLAPTPQMVCEWLRQVAEYHIEVLAVYHFRVFDGYSFEVYSLFSNEHVDYANEKGVFKTAPEACNAGIKFCLERLPKKD